MTTKPSLLDLPPETAASRSVLAGVGAITLHVGLAVFALSLGAEVTRRVVTPDISELIEVELPAEPEALPELEPEVAPEPEPAPTPAPVREAPAAAAPTQDPPAPAEAPAPAPAESGKVLTADEEIVDFGDTIISGPSEQFAGGLSSVLGSSKIAVRSPNARPGGVPGGKGTGPAAPTPRAPSQARPPRLAGGMHWDCPFPPEADMEQINQSAVSLAVQVAPDGKVRNIVVTNDPGFGFGREARRCAMRKRWDPGLDELGRPTGATARVKVQFRR